MPRGKQFKNGPPKPVIHKVTVALPEDVYLTAEKLASEDERPLAQFLFRIVRDHIKYATTLQSLTDATTNLPPIEEN